jgi:hypothetical protein
MRGFWEKWDRLFSAITFAEAGEFGTARELMRENARDEKRDTVIKRKIPRISAPGVKRQELQSITGPENVNGTTKIASMQI